jgi:predicted outer membrane protein
MRSCQKIVLRFIVVFVLAGLPAATACAQVENPSSDTGGGFGEATGPASLGHPGTDEFYVENGLRFTNVGVVLSRLAQEKASSADVRSLAKQAADTHLSIGAGLVESAKMLGVKVPAGLPPRYETDFHELQKLSGVEFDKKYLDVLVRLQHDDYGVMWGEYGPGGTKRDNFHDQAEHDANDLNRLTDKATKLQKKLAKS